MTEQLPWFAARLLFESTVEGRSLADALYEERIVLVHSASGIEAAQKKAQKLGKSASEEYENEAGESIAWRFKEVLDVVQLNDAAIGEGSEVYHQYLTASEVDQVRESLKSIA